MVDGIVYLVGAGPGAPDLLTIRARDVLQKADVILYDRLIDPAVLRHASPKAELIDVGHGRLRHADRQSFINNKIVELAREGRTVVRLKGGDPLIFGRGFEEAKACQESGIRSVVVPGLSSALAAPAAAGIPITERKAVRSVAIVTAAIAGEGRKQHLDFASLAGADTLIIMMGWQKLAAVLEGLRAAGKPGETPVACIHSATTAAQKVVVSTMLGIVDAARNAGIAAPVVTVVGDVAAYADAEGHSIAGPLSGRRIVLTREEKQNDALAMPLRALGATVIECPLLRVEYHDVTPETGNAYRRMAQSDWLLLTSRHAVEAMSRHLDSLGLDSRAIGDCRVAVIGDATAEAIRKKGIRPDLVADPHTADGLLNGLDEGQSMEAKRIIYPHSDLSDGKMVDRLRKRGCDVVAFPAYANAAVDVDRETREAIGRGVEIVVFCSSSAARRASEIPEFGLRHSTIACLGPATAQAVIDLGLPPPIVPEKVTLNSLVEAIVKYVSETEVST